MGGGRKMSKRIKSSEDYSVFVRPRGEQSRACCSGGEAGVPPLPCARARRGEGAAPVTTYVTIA